MVPQEQQTNDKGWMGQFTLTIIKDIHTKCTLGHYHIVDTLGSNQTRMRISTSYIVGYHQ